MTHRYHPRWSGTDRMAPGISPIFYSGASKMLPGIDTHPGVAAFAKNAGLGFSIPYLHNGQPHEYVPDFIIRLAGEPDRYLVLETKGFDELV